MISDQCKKLLKESNKNYVAFDVIIDHFQTNIQRTI